MTDRELAEARLKKALALRAGADLIPVRAGDVVLACALGGSRPSALAAALRSGASAARPDATVIVRAADVAALLEAIPEAPPEVPADG